ncbi:hypothetical protein [Luteolibacter marinus]|uniref:hypothetical protein n=1 Tax=Luteolibacter marinus TaxID=2776705 RepID=UPI001868AB59|nr:hypothetical protein [Luteolibacter marinus]
MLGDTGSPALARASRVNGEGFFKMAIYARCWPATPGISVASDSELDGRQRKSSTWACFPTSGENWSPEAWNPGSKRHVGKQSGVNSAAEALPDWTFLFDLERGRKIGHFEKTKPRSSGKIPDSSDQE